MDTLTLEQRTQLAIKAFQSGDYPSKRSAAIAFNVLWATRVVFATDLPA
jgi:hypothetical protein